MPEPFAIWGHSSLRLGLLIYGLFFLWYLLNQFLPYHKLPQKSKAVCFGKQMNTFRSFGILWYSSFVTILRSMEIFRKISKLERMYTIQLRESHFLLLCSPEVTRKGLKQRREERDGVGKDVSEMNWRWCGRSETSWKPKLVLDHNSYDLQRSEVFAENWWRVAVVLSWPGQVFRLTDQSSNLGISGPPAQKLHKEWWQQWEVWSS